MLHTENMTWVNRKKKKNEPSALPPPPAVLEPFLPRKIMSRVLHYEITNLCIYAGLTC